MRPGTDPTRQLTDAGALWLLGDVSQRVVVQAACDLLAAGLGGDALAVLAGHPFGHEADTWRLEADLRAALREDFQVGLPDRETDELLMAGVRAMCRRRLRGEISARALAGWAHARVGHDGPDSAQMLVESDDTYDAVDSGFTAESADQIDAAVDAEAQRLVDELQS